MEKRIGSIIILVLDKSSTHLLNSTISRFSEIIIGRQGIPSNSSGFGIISLVLEGTTDQLGALTGQLGRIKGIKLKSVLLKVQDDKLV